MKRLERAAQISAISSVRAALSAGVPPKKAASAGAAASAIPPRPMHSSTAESPMSRAASSSPWPSRSRTSWTGAAGAVNQRPGSPASWMPTSVPLRDISVTTLDPSVPLAASEAHFAAAIVRLRKKWWLPAMKRADASPPIAANAGASSRISRFRVAWLRMCSSSPIASPSAASAKTSIGPPYSSSCASAGPSSSRKNRSRATASSSPTPNHSVCPGPSLSVE